MCTFPLKTALIGGQRCQRLKHRWERLPKTHKITLLGNVLHINGRVAYLWQKKRRCTFRELLYTLIKPLNSYSFLLFTGYPGFCHTHINSTAIMAKDIVAQVPQTLHISTCPLLTSLLNSQHPLMSVCTTHCVVTFPNCHECVPEWAGEPD